MLPDLVKVKDLGMLVTVNHEFTLQDAATLQRARRLPELQ
jgi:hypothetical protein